MRACIAPMARITRVGFPKNCHVFQRIKISWMNLLKVNCTNWQILDLNAFKAFAGDKLNVVRIMISVCETEENIVGKGGNAGYQHFLLFPLCFQKPSLPGSLKVRIVWQKIIPSNIYVKFKVSSFREDSPREHSCENLLKSSKLF